MVHGVTSVTTQLHHVGLRPWFVCEPDSIVSADKSGFAIAGPEFARVPIGTYINVGVPRSVGHCHAQAHAEVISRVDYLSYDANLFDSLVGRGSLGRPLGTSEEYARAVMHLEFPGVQGNVVIHYNKNPTAPAFTDGWVMGLGSPAQFNSSAKVDLIVQEGGRK
jgi:hypothetical protein